MNIQATVGLLTVLAADVPVRDAGADRAGMATAPPSPAARVVSPEVHPDRRVTFRLWAPKATEVTVSGVGPGPAAMRKDVAGLWSVTLGPLEPDMYHYTFVVDGVRTIDPAPMAPVAAGAVSSTSYNRFVIRGEIPAIDELLPVPHGVVRQHVYRSKSLDVGRRVVVYTPPDYESPKKRRYPVLYLLHGARNGETFWTDFARVNLVVDNLIASGAVKPLIIVMPNGNMPGGRPEPSEVLLGRNLTEDVIPWVEAAFRVKAGARYRAIAGFSMGGGQAFAIALNQLGRFSHLATFSAYLGDAQLSATFKALPAATTAVNGKLPFIWMGCGTEDGLLAANEQASASLRERGITHTFHKTSGGHSWKLARSYLHELLPKMFADR
jgi:enterochelin esterase-like enzyme